MYIGIYVSMILNLIEIYPSMILKLVEIYLSMIFQEGCPAWYKWIGAVNTLLLFRSSKDATILYKGEIY